VASKKNYLIKGLKNPKNAWYVTKTNFEITASRLLFKNTAGFKNNLEGRKLQKLTREKPDVKEDFNQNVLQLQESGFTHLGSPFEPSLIMKIKKKYETLIDDNNYSFVRSCDMDGRVYSRMINEAYKIFPEVINLITPDIKKMVRGYYQSNFQILHVELWRTYHIPREINMKKEMYGSYWHCDGANTAITTMFVNMSDVTDKDGPLHFQSIKRTKELIKMGYKTRRNYNLPLDIIEDLKHVLKHKGSTGSAVWVNTQFCLHRAGIPEPNRHRDMMQIRFIPSKDLLYDDWPNHCEPSNDEIRFNQTKAKFKVD